MKKLLFVFSALFCASLFPAQNNSKEAVEPVGDSPFTIGSRGAFGHSFMLPYNNNVFHPSWEIGVAMQLMTGEHLGFSADGLYSSEGATFRSGEMEEKIALSYFRIPARINYFFRDRSRDFRPKIAIGPGIGFLLEEGNFAGFEKMDYGASASLGFSYRLLRGLWLHADASYYQGLKDIYKGNRENDRNGNIRFEAGLLVGF